MLDAHREDLGFIIQLQPQHIPQPTPYDFEQIMQKCLIVMHDNKVIHIANISFNAKILLHEYVQFMEINIGPQLACEVANGKTRLP